MAEEKVLSQDEIDALLSNVEEEGDDASTGEDSGAGIDELTTSEGITALDFDNQDKIIRGQFPVLERIYDKMLRQVVDDVLMLMSRDISIKQEHLTILKAREFMAEIELPLVVNIYRFHPLRSKALIIFDSTLMYDLVENYFGGHTHLEDKLAPDKEFTPTEIRIMGIITNFIEKRLESAWEPIKQINIEKIATETNPQLVNIYAPTDILVASKFNVSFESEAGHFFIVLPYLMIDPIREHLEVGGAQTDQEHDPNWVNALKKQLMDVPLEVNAVLARTILQLEEIKEWKEGDFIPLEIEDTTALNIEGFPTFRTEVGNFNDKCALKILSKFEYK